MGEKACLDVAIGVLRRKNEVLISQRRADAVLPGLWEFPGGKCHDAEPSGLALRRELDEELGILVQEAKLELSLWHRYSHADIMLHIYSVSQFSGVPKGVEGQPVRWVEVDELGQYRFPEGNDVILSALESHIF